jgi:sporadic carbohydrate cluster protein (TIGR04323 family)
MINRSAVKQQGYRGYVTSRPFMGERAPQHIQNLVIRDYAKRHGLEYRLSATEYAMEGSRMMLEQVLAELPSLQGMICYSIFQLPLKSNVRNGIYRKVLEIGAELHAAVEGLSIKDERDAARIEDIWRVRQALPLCPNTTEIATYSSSQE